MSTAKCRIRAAHILQRLADTRMSADPAIPAISAVAPGWPASFLQKIAAGLKPAGVLIPLIDRQDGLSVLFTQRSSELRLHAGQVSFPGGRMESGDVDICATALRETHEEVGIPPEAVRIAGYLDPLPTVTGYAVTPVVGILGPSVSVCIDPVEVEATFEVPLEFLMDKSHQTHSSREFEGVQLAVVEFNYAGRRIWGATATMLLRLRELLIDQ